MHRGSTIPALLLALVTTLLLPAASSDARPEPQLISQVRVVHAAAGGPLVDVFVDGLRAVTGVAFGGATPHINLAAGAHQFALVPTGGALAAAIFTTELEMAAGQPYTLMAIGAPPTIAPYVLLDDRIGAAGGIARVRFVHASPNAPALDLAVVGGVDLFTNVAYNETTPYLDLPAGTPTLEIRVAGSGGSILTVPNVSLAAGEAYSLAAIGLVSGTPPLGILPLVDS